MMLYQAPPAVVARLSEWKVELAPATVPAGTVTFSVTNGGSVPHAFEVEGHGLEKETPLIQPGATATLTLTLVQTWQTSCDGLAASLDGIMYKQLRKNLRRSPWIP